MAAMTQSRAFVAQPLAATRRAAARRVSSGARGLGRGDRAPHSL
jgi:hypothetical protein